MVCPLPSPFLQRVPPRGVEAGGGLSHTILEQPLLVQVKATTGTHLLPPFLIFNEFTSIPIQEPVVGLYRLN